MDSGRVEGFLEGVEFPVQDLGYLWFHGSGVEDVAGFKITGLSWLRIWVLRIEAYHGGLKCNGNLLGGGWGVISSMPAGLAVLHPAVVTFASLRQNCRPLSLMLEGVQGFGGSPKLNLPNSTAALTLEKPLKVLEPLTPKPQSLRKLPPHRRNTYRHYSSGFLIVIIP